jgi:hypothetical protein
MPNECYNHITISSPTTDDIIELYEKELVKTKEQEEDDTLYYYKNITIQKQTKKIIIFNQTTRWHPDYDWLEGLLIKYPNCWIKNVWHDEDALEGIWIGNTGDEDNIIMSQWVIPFEVYNDRYGLK